MHFKKAPRHSFLLTCLLIVGIFSSCTQPQSPVLPSETVDVQSTVDSAIAATSTAEAQQSSIIATAVAATQTAQPTPQTEPTTNDAPSDAEPAQNVSTETYVTLTEEELATLIDASVNEAVLATQAASDVTNTAAADETITQVEADEIEDIVSDAEEAIALAEELMWVYAELYGEVAQETLVLIDELELVLDATADLLIVMVDILEDVNYALEAGIELTAETLAALNEAAQQAGVYASSMSEKSQNWQQTVESELTRRVDQMLALVPADVAATRLEALENAAGYITTARDALVDQTLTQAELNTIAQMGVDAVAGLQAQGGPLMISLAEQINGITTAFARGELPNIQGKLAELESMLPSRP